MTTTNNGFSMITPGSPLAGQSGSYNPQASGIEFLTSYLAPYQFDESSGLISADCYMALPSGKGIGQVTMPVGLNKSEFSGHIYNTEAPSQNLGSSNPSVSMFSAVLCLQDDAIEDEFKMYDSNVAIQAAISPAVTRWREFSLHNALRSNVIYQTFPVALELENTSMSQLVYDPSLVNPVPQQATNYGFLSLSKLAEMYQLAGEQKLQTKQGIFLMSSYAWLASKSNLQGINNQWTSRNFQADNRSAMGTRGLGNGDGTEVITNGEYNINVTTPLDYEPTAGYSLVVGDTSVAYGNNPNYRADYFYYPLPYDVNANPTDTKKWRVVEMTYFISKRALWFAFHTDVQALMTTYGRINGDGIAHPTPQGAFDELTASMKRGGSMTNATSSIYVKTVTGTGMTPIRNMRYFTYSMVCGAAVGRPQGIIPMPIVIPNKNWSQFAGRQGFVPGTNIPQSLSAPVNINRNQTIGTIIATTPNATTPGSILNGGGEISQADWTSAMTDVTTPANLPAGNPTWFTYYGPNGLNIMS